MTIGNMMKNKKKIEGFIGGTVYSEAYAFSSTYRRWVESLPKGSTSVGQAMQGK